MLVTALPIFLYMLFGHHSAAGAMKPRAVDQTGLKRLELFAGNNMVVNVNDHGGILSAGISVLRIRDRHVAVKRDYWSIGLWPSAFSQYSITLSQSSSSADVT